MIFFAGHDGLALRFSRPAADSGSPRWHLIYMGVERSTVVASTAYRHNRACARQKRGVRSPRRLHDRGARRRRAARGLARHECERSLAPRWRAPAWRGATSRSTLRSAARSTVAARLDRARRAAAAARQFAGARATRRASRARSARGDERREARDRPASRDELLGATSARPAARGTPARAPRRHRRGSRAEAVFDCAHDATARLLDARGARPPRDGLLQRPCCPRFARLRRTERVLRPSARLRVPRDYRRPDRGG